MMKNPMFMIGMIFAVILYMDLNRRGILGSRVDKLKATSCNAVLVKLNKKIPNSWTTHCNDNNLEVFINTQYLVDSKDTKKTLRPKMYRELANHLAFIAKNSPYETLERVLMVTVKLDNKTMVLAALTEGQYIVKLSTLRSNKFIIEHLKSTVQTQEKFK